MANTTYFRGNEAEQFTFYRIPKALFTDERFRGLSVFAKLLYGLLLDRMSLSAHSGWLDDLGRVYIYFTLEGATALLSISHSKATRLFNELEACGLIRRKRQGQGKPTQIYVMNFASDTPDPKATENGASEYTEVLTSENEQSGLHKTSSLDCTKTDSNKTEKSDTECCDTDLSIYLPAPLPKTELCFSRHEPDSQPAQGLAAQRESKYQQPRPPPHSLPSNHQHQRKGETIEHSE